MQNDNNNQNTKWIQAQQPWSKTIGLQKGRKQSQTCAQTDAKRQNEIQKKNKTRKHDRKDLKHNYEYDIKEPERKQMITETKRPQTDDKLWQLWATWLLEGEFKCLCPGACCLKISPCS